ncbi:motile sperm domain-containing protein 3 isoform X1 [Mus musculus]|uniref:motile sperm domain-containing protein 3 isoform X1 n=1 Tax=Mus musculus TaxID=10090 RepID=UPI0003D74CD4|nr:motile sperm domain-containing protein 3 isoform X1 [Mus musculus]XP_006504676.1 motile sperm domain-containing protein 3 isoform X1 [Mus musculus]|eukprot:XP_006504675.1 PREDICTED: motile sperm domain-containing protein 3 isoform X1 [Mus musculus]
MRRGAPQDQELVGPGAPGRGSRGSPPSSGPVVPVLVFPPDLVFRADQRSGPRQLLTLYNPTGTALRFRVLCTAPAKYTVFDAEGYVKPQSCIDIVIRHVAPVPSHYDVQDRFRIELSEEGTEGRVVGRKDITSVLRAPAYPLELQGHSEPTPNPGPPVWTGLTPARHLQESVRKKTLQLSWFLTSNQRDKFFSSSNCSVSDAPQQLATSSFLLFLLAGVISVAFLLLPLQDELGSQLPQVLHVSLGQKLVAAYVLGLLTMVLLRT